MGNAAPRTGSDCCASSDGYPNGDGYTPADGDAIANGYPDGCDAVAYRHTPACAHRHDCHANGHGDAASNPDGNRRIPPDGRIRGDGVPGVGGFGGYVYSDGEASQPFPCPTTR